MSNPFPDFGHDLSLAFDLDLGMSESDGLVTLAQALVRRLQCPQGGLIGDPNYGFDLLGEIDDDVTQADIARIAATVDAEFQKDERVLTSSTAAVFASGTLLAHSTVTTAGGPFKLVLTAANVVSLIQVVPLAKGH
jgi:phage baseplate assembly protein W